MVKTINPLAAKLAAARTKIDSLERQINDLSRENERLRASSTCSTPTRSDPGVSPTSTPRDHKPRTPSTTYDKPTRSYEIRLAETRRAKHSTEPVKRREFHIGDGTYTYVNACLVRIDKSHCPGYMRNTQSFWAKSEYRLHPYLRASKSSTEERSKSPEDFDQPPEATIPPKASTPPKASREAKSTPPKPTLYNTEDVHALLTESISKLFPGRLLRVPGRIGHDMLSTAYQMAQEAFHEAAHKYWPRLWQDIHEGPYLVKLGRTELEEFVGPCGCSVDLSLCGTDSKVVFWALMDMVYFRNAMYHPQPDTFRVLENVDLHLSRAEMFIIALRDEKRAETVKALRNRLRQVAVETFGELKRYAPLAVLPFANEVEPPHWETHHKEVLKEVLFHKVQGRELEGGWKEMYDDLIPVAETWALAKMPHLLERPVW